MTYNNRHECKFVVPAAVATRVRQRVLPFVVPDPHAARYRDDTYPIASLYLDDAGRSLYRETVEGRHSRFKLRVRAYDDRVGSPVFLEVKYRHDRVVRKLRCPVPRQRLAAVLAGAANPVPDLPPHQQLALQEFVRLQQLRRAYPHLIVRYLRQAYVGRDNNDVRVTFDRNLMVAAESAPIVRHAGRFEPLPVRSVVLELKFTDRCPPWLLDVVRACELRRGSFSKYCRSAEALADFGHAVAR